MTLAASKLASLNIVIDKLHFKGHTDSWCHSNCNPYDVKELEEVQYIYESITSLHDVCYCYFCRSTQKFANKHFRGCQDMAELPAT